MKKKLPSTPFLLFACPPAWRRVTAGCLLAGCLIAGAMPAGAQPAPKPDATVDLSQFVESTGFTARAENRSLTLTWQISPQESGVLQLNLVHGQPLITRLGLIQGGKSRDLLRELTPLVFLTIGERNLQNPTGWMAFFDRPIERAYQHSAVKFDLKQIRVTNSGSRMQVVVNDVTAAPFAGRFEFTLFDGSPLVFAEAVMQTPKNGVAFLYDAGLGAGIGRPDGVHEEGPSWKTVAWRDESAGKLTRAPVNLNHVIAPIPVRGRAIVAENPTGSVALFPPPHQYFQPLDFASNLGHVWHGRSGNSNFFWGYGLGIRQPPEGDRRFASWFNAPPGTDQRMGVFYLLHGGNADAALDAVARYTHNDRFKPLPGHVRFTSHYHIEHTLQLATRRKELGDPAAMPEDLRDPEFVRTFKARGIDIVHLGEFHVMAMPRLPLERRLPLMKLMFDELERLSDAELLLLPGEEPNVHLGGHWMAFFPKPVYWVLNRPEGAPFVSEVPGYGRVYQVGDAADVLRLMELERGLMWTAHPRIKSSFGFPELHRDTPFYQSDHFLGGAWKNMPIDLSLPRLGTRALDLQDDMANRGERKYILGEADLFGIEANMETYGHLNINYLKLDRVPKFSEGWQPVLDALRGGKFFVSTGEVLLPTFTVDGKSSGETVTLAANGQARFRAQVDWTFPLAFAELVSGDGRQVFRHRIDLGDTRSFGTRDLDLPIDLKGRTWVRLEVWDVARNGAFTPPVWLEPRP